MGMRHILNDIVDFVPPPLESPVLDSVVHTYFAHDLDVKLGWEWGLNAEAIWPNKIRVSLSLVDELDSLELVGVLAHELAHLEYNHLAQRKPFHDAAYGKSLYGPSAKAYFDFSQAQEYEADRYAMRHLRRCGLDPHLLHSGLKKVLAGDLRDLDPYREFSVHPLPRPRLAHAKKYAAELQRAGRCAKLRNEREYHDS